MNMRYEPPLDIIIVGRPGSTDWCRANEAGKVEWRFFDELFRCFSYDIGSPHAANPAIPVYFSIGDFGGDDQSSPPPLIDVARARSTIVFVLLDSGFRRATESWAGFFGKMRKRAQESSRTIRFIPMARANDGHLSRDLQRLGLGLIAPLYPQGHDKRQQQPNDVARFFRISAMVAAIQALCSDPKSMPISLFISYTRRDGEQIAHQLSTAVQHLGIGAVIDSKAFDPGVPIEVDLLAQKLAAATCMVVLLTNAYSSRVWCRREMLLAKGRGVPIVVVDMLSDLDRVGPHFANCPFLKMGQDVDFDRIVELAVSEALRVSHHKSRSAAILALAGIDPQRVEVLSQAPELPSLVDLAARNAEAVDAEHKPKDLILYPDPPLLEDELSLLRKVDPKFQFLTPTTIFLTTAATEVV